MEEGRRSHPIHVPEDGPPWLREAQLGGEARLDPLVLALQSAPKQAKDARGLVVGQVSFAHPSSVADGRISTLNVCP